MDTPPTLFPVPAPGPAGLTERQRIAHGALVAAGHDGMSADEIGAVLHEHAGRHAAGGRCMWCGESGREVLRALRRKGLARSRRGGQWTSLDEGGTAPAGHADGDHGRPPSSSDGPGDFPEGF